MIRVLIVDDSATARDAIAAILTSTGEIEVVGQASNGTEGIEMACQLRPDVITMDIVMPMTNGREATRQIMRCCPTPILVVSSVTREEMVRSGLDLLLEGALDIVQKPTRLSDCGMDQIREDLIAKIKAIAKVKMEGRD